jgi:hypothetical protein
VEFVLLLYDHADENDMSRATTHVRRQMTWLGKILLLLLLAGCSSSGGLFSREEPKPEPLANQAIPPTGQQQATPNRGSLSPAASAAAPPGADESSGELMDCVTQSCKINCSPKLAARFKPKWCDRFKEPAD